MPPCGRWPPCGPASRRTASREGLNKFIKGLGIKGVQSSTQGDQLRVQSKKRDDLKP